MSELTKEYFEQYINDVTSNLVTKKQFEDVTSKLVTQTQFEEVASGLVTKKQFEDVTDGLVTKKQFEETTSALVSKKQFEDVTGKLVNKDEFEKSTSKLVSKEYFSQEMASRDDSMKKFITSEVENLAGMVKQEFDSVNNQLETMDSRVRVYKLEDDMSKIKDALNL